MVRNNVLLSVDLTSGRAKAASNTGMGLTEKTVNVRSSLRRSLPGMSETRLKLSVVASDRGAAGK